MTRLAAPRDDTATLARVAPEVLAALGGEASAEAGIAALDELLGDVGRELAAAEDAIGRWVRVAWASGGLGAVLEVPRALGQGVSGLPLLLGALGVGGVSAALCAGLSRGARGRAEQARRAWDALAQRLVGRLGVRSTPADGPPPARRLVPKGSR